MMVLNYVWYCGWDIDENINRDKEIFESLYSLENYTIVKKNKAIVVSINCNNMLFKFLQNPMTIEYELRKNRISACAECVLSLYCRVCLGIVALVSIVFLTYLIVSDNMPLGLFSALSLSIGMFIGLMLMFIFMIKNFRRSCANNSKFIHYVFNELQIKKMLIEIEND